jgi:hypothetical protein
MLRDEMMQTIFDEYMGLKCAAVGLQPDDCDIPMLLYLGERPYDDPKGEVLCVVLQVSGFQDACAALAHAMAEKFIPYWAAMLSDGYTAKNVDVPTEFNHPGGLGEMMKLGLPDVREVLSLVACDKAGDLYSISRTYYFDADGDIFFDDDEGPAMNSHGTMVDVLRDCTSLWGLSDSEVHTELMRRSPDMN